MQRATDSVENSRGFSIRSRKSEQSLNLGVATHNLEQIGIGYWVLDQISTMAAHFRRQQLKREFFNRMGPKLPVEPAENGQRRSAFQAWQHL